MSNDEYKELLKSQPDSLCKICHSRLSTYVLLPSHLKVFNHPVMFNLISKLSSIIRKTEKVLFIGYSMLEADVHICAHMHRRKEKLQKSMIINP